MKPVRVARAPCRLHFASPVWYALLVSAMYLALLNQRFWREAVALCWRGNAGDLPFLVALFLLLLSGFSLALLLLPGRRLMHVASGVLFPLGAMAAYTADSYGLAVDADMVRSLAHATRGEAGALLGPRLLLYALLLGVLPMFVVGSSRIAPLPLRQHLRHRLLFCGAALALAALLMSAFAARFNVLLRSHAPYLLVPAAALQGAARYVASDLASWRPDGQARQAAPADAPQRLPSSRGSRPLVVLLVVGETARHASFQLGGYARPTNPLLSAMPGVYYFSNVTSCGTTTAVSLPCMFSPLGRDRFTVAGARAVPNALEQLAAAGVRVAWRANNAGSSVISARLPTVTYPAQRPGPGAPPALCDAASCLDEAMLAGLEQALAQVDRDSLFGFHQMGSHGPDYFRRYPAAAQRFSPACRRQELTDCSVEEIRNAYDNTIVYTDRFLAAQIALLESRSDRLDSALLYLSDHGESLGEQGVFLHGAPYAAAPQEQKRIPLLLWMSDGYQRRMGMDGRCLTRQLDQPFSHDNVYHTLLGMMATSDRHYRTDMDLLAGCRVSN
ncbi:sulfatase-like hydrolase/transferase [Noviherbaspirillum sp. L7-7A]|uniref:phosphoethanolamine transferase n=1 Tax=Noviherbaspirillum sp. L7-7A TaxID=2850560 RepID=UPI002010D274|nr:sulfatase-like hydrolase/transferase [Noviherbaspirillum sp. L7-7A]